MTTDNPQGAAPSAQQPVFGGSACAPAVGDAAGWDGKESQALTDFERRLTAEDPRYPARKAALEALDAYMNQWVEEYEFDDGESRTHAPSEFEQFLILDALHGLLADDEYERLRAAWQSLCGPQVEQQPPVAPQQPLPVELVITALLAMDSEARKRGAMFPQTADEQREDTKAVRNVIASLEFFGSGRQRGPDGAPSITGWPALPLYAAPSPQAPQQPLTEKSPAVTNPMAEWPWQQPLSVHQAAPPAESAQGRPSNDAQGTEQALWKWVPSYSESYPNSTRLQRLRIHHEDGTAQDLVDISEVARPSAADPASSQAAPRLDGPGALTDEQRAIVRSVGGEQAWRDLMRRFTVGQRMHVANLLAHSYTITAIEIEDSYGSRPSRLVGEISRDDARTALSEERQRKGERHERETMLVWQAHTQPALLEALRKCRNTLLAGADNKSQSGRDAIDSASTAIKKATGSEQ